MIIQLKNLSFAFGHSWTLNNISFELKRGEFLFLSGPSGAGKTTLMRILHGALPLKSGYARVAGFNLREIQPANLHLLRRQVSVVFQDFKILPQKTVYENIALALRVRSMSAIQVGRRVRAVMRSLHLEKKSNCLCQELSGGEQQRVATARAIVVGPQLLLADEPTGNLDQDLALHLLEVFRHFHRHGTSVVLATHNKSLLTSQPGAKILRLKQGQIVDANWPLTYSN